MCDTDKYAGSHSVPSYSFYTNRCPVTQFLGLQLLPVLGLHGPGRVCVRAQVSGGDMRVSQPQAGGDCLDPLEEAAGEPSQYGHTRTLPCLATSPSWDIAMSGHRDQSAVIWDPARFQYPRVSSLW